MKNLRILIPFSMLTALTVASDWPSWRGPHQTGSSDETGLISRWTVDGENQIWRTEFIGRSTPVAFDGRVCALGRAEDEGKHISKREIVACYNAENGNLLWRRDIPVFLTTVPYTRAGWASVAADPETGALYVHGVGGHFAAYDKEGKTLWRRSLTEEFSRFSGYGGRTHTPVIDGDLVILSFGVVGGWGSLTPPRHRYFAFDKRSGELIWLSQPAEAPTDLNTYGVPIVHEINGRRLLIHGNGDGYVYALEVNTGRLVWKYALSQRGINTAVVADGNIIYATHGEENRDSAEMGRTVAIDGTGSGDVSATHEKWRHATGSGFVSPLLQGNRLYIVTNSANLLAIDTQSGKTQWELSLGTVGKGSPVFADGRIYAPEVNGRFLIVEPGDEEGRILSQAQVTMPEGRYAEIYGSPAVAYGRIYLATENGLFCLGDPSKPFRAEPSPALPTTPTTDPNAEPAQLVLVPAETVIRPGGRVDYRIRAYDDQGNFLREIPEGQFSTQGIAGEFRDGVFHAPGDVPFQAGTVSVKVGELQAGARLRVLAEPPFSLDFSDLEEGQSHPYFIGARPRFKGAVEEGGEKILAQPPFGASYDRGFVYLGPPEMRNYTVQAEVKGTQVRRNAGDFGLLNQRYVFHVMHGRYLHIFSWISENRVEAKQPFDWQPDQWYTMKMRVDMEDGQAVVKGKIWLRGQDEPEGWSLTAVDPLAIDHGSPGIFGISRTTVFFDNVKVTNN